MSNRFFDNLFLFDRLIISYSLLMVALLAVLGKPFSEYSYEFSVYSFTAITAILIVRFVDPNKGIIFRFVRLLYAPLMFALFYRTTAGTMHLVFDQFLDLQLTTFEYSVLGFNPTLYIDVNLLNVWANELFSFCYYCYYPMIPVFVITLFIKKDDDTLKQFLATASLTFVVGYLLFFLYPIEGPRYFFATDFVNTIDGPLFRQLVNSIIATGAVHGGCMPSTHIAIAVVINIACFRRYPMWGKILLPINIGLAIGTVWGRFHYISDAIVGIAIAFAADWTIRKWSERESIKNDNFKMTRKVTSEHAA